jgi:Rad3-related DNA helicase
MPRPRAACGTFSAYKRHKRLGETVDAACADAARKQQQDRRAEARTASAAVVQLAVAAEPAPTGIDELDELRENLRIVRATMQDAPHNTIAALSKRRQELVAEIRRVERLTKPEASALDQLANRRAARIAAASS